LWYILNQNQKQKEKAMLNTDGFKKFIKLDNEKKKLKKRLEEIESQKKTLQQDLIENLLDKEMTKISIAGKTVYINSIVRAKILDREQAITALREAGYHEFIKENFNTNSISALLRELQESEGIPELFKDAIEPVEVTDLRVIAA